LAMNLDKVQQKYIQFILIATMIIMAISITPNISTDPINLPRLVIVDGFAFAAIGIALLSPRGFISSIDKKFLTFILLFIIQLTLVLFFAPGNKSEMFFGTFGRNTGYLAYIGLAFIALSASIVVTIEFLKMFSTMVVALWVISIFYSALQKFGADPFDWNNPYNSIIGFLGNPNFQSSFLAFCSIVGFALILGKSGKLFTLLLSILIVLSLLIIVSSNSVQGLIVFLGSSGVIFFLYLHRHETFRKKIFTLPYIGFFAVSSLIAILGALNKGPLASLLYQDSVRQRGFYWNTAVSMMRDFPLFGVGLDSFGNWYFKYRPLRAAELTPDVATNAAHNVFLDFGANGGIPLFLIHLLLTAYTLFCVVRYLLREKSFSSGYAAVLGIWIGYELQALISINNLGIAIWGWVTMGLLIGIDHNSRILVPAVVKNISNGRVVKRNRSPRNLILVASCTGLVGLWIPGIAFMADVNYRTALVTRDANKLILATKANPSTTYRNLSTLEALVKSQLNPQALDIVEFALKQNPRVYNGWLLKRNLSKPGSPEYIEAVKKLNELDPNRKQS
jgi:hypothetical protein